eukprot:4263214-Pleurochrysis_carterae.AAC.1
MRRVPLGCLSCADWASRAVGRHAPCASGSPCANECPCTIGREPIFRSTFRSAQGEVASGPQFCCGSRRHVRRRRARRLGLPRVRAG